MRAIAAGGGLGGSSLAIKPLDVDVRVPTGTAYALSESRKWLSLFSAAVAVGWVLLTFFEWRQARSRVNDAIAMR